MGFILCAERVNRYIKENIMKDLENGILSYVTVGEFLADLKQEFESGETKESRTRK